MKITIFGTGYVGLVTGTCLAEVGNEVVCIDIDQNKIDDLNRGKIPIYEPGLETMVQENRQTGRLKFTTNIQEAVSHGLFQFIAVGTPPDEDGSADLQYVLAVAQSIAEHMSEYRVIIDKSTVPVGTAEKVKEVIQNTLTSQNKAIAFDVVSNPEFLKEGSALADFMKPDRIIVGTDNTKTTELLKTLYAPFNRSQDRVIEMDIRSAELCKYAANAMLATKISFMNELANLAELVEADIEKVRQGIGSDSRIGFHFIYPGCGYGGSCFPKDVKALIQSAQGVEYNAELLQAVENVNQRQKQVLFKKINQHFSGDIQNKVFAIWGLSFKPKTDDMREAASIVLIKSIIAAGGQVQAFDPEAMEEARKTFGELAGLTLCNDKETVLENADALCIVTEWKNFWSPDFDLIKAKLNDSVIFDGRNLYDPVHMQSLGFKYYGIGRL